MSKHAVKYSGAIPPITFFKRPSLLILNSHLINALENYQKIVHPKDDPKLIKRNAFENSSSRFAWLQLLQTVFCKVLT